MIIYQIRSFEHQAESCPNITCPLCHQQGGINISIRQRYIWWLGPMAPSTKYGIAWCNKCEEKIPNVKWTTEIVQRYKELKSNTQTPLRLWRGMLVIATIFVVLFLLGKVLTKKRSLDANELTEYFAKPQPGDIYYASTGGKYETRGNAAYATDQVFSLYKVLKVNGDSVFLAQGNGRRISSADAPINEYTSGFWDAIEKETSTYGPVPTIISHQSMVKYRYFTPLSGKRGDAPGKISNIKRQKK